MPRQQKLIYQNKTFINNKESLLSRWSTSCMFPLLSSLSVNNPALLDSSIILLSTLLEDSPALSLAFENENIINQILDLFNKSTSDINLNKVLLGVAIQRGKLSCILDAIYKILISKFDLNTLDIRKYLNQMQNMNV